MGRFKDEIKPMDNASEALLKLKPGSFRYEQELDLDKIPHLDVIAEEVEKVHARPHGFNIDRKAAGHCNGA